MGVGGQPHVPAASTTGKDLVPIAQEAGWAPRPVWTGAENLAPPPAFDPRTVQSVASHYSDWATRLTVSGIMMWFAWITYKGTNNYPSDTTLTVKNLFAASSFDSCYPVLKLCKIIKRENLLIFVVAPCMLIILSSLFVQLMHTIRIKLLNC